MGATWYIAAGKGVSIVLECEEFEEWLSEYADGTLDGVRKELLEGHLRFCPRCTEVLGRMRHLAQALHRLGEESPSAAFQLRLDRRLGEARLRQHRRARRSLRWGIAVAVALVWLLWPGSDPEPTHPASIAERGAASSGRARARPRPPDAIAPAQQ